MDNKKIGEIGAVNEAPPSGHMRQPNEGPVDVESSSQLRAKSKLNG